MVSKSKKKRGSKDTESLETIGRASLRFWRRWETIQGSDDLIPLKEFEMKLNEFLTKLTSGWMGKKFGRLKPENQIFLQGVNFVLGNTLVNVRNLRVNIERGKKIRTEIQDLDTPVVYGEAAQYSLPEKFTSPYNHSEKLVSSIHELSAP
jgi:hypothetical protein